MNGGLAERRAAAMEKADRPQWVDSTHSRNRKRSFAAALVIALANGNIKLLLRSKV